MFNFNLNQYLHFHIPTPCSNSLNREFSYYYGTPGCFVLSSNLGRRVISIPCH